MYIIHIKYVGMEFSQRVCVCGEEGKGGGGEGGVGYVTLYIVHITQIGGSLNIMAACQHFVIFSVCLPIELVSSMSEPARQ